MNMLPNASISRFTQSEAAGEIGLNAFVSSCLGCAEKSVFCLL